MRLIKYDYLANGLSRSMGHVVEVPLERDALLRQLQISLFKEVSDLRRVRVEDEKYLLQLPVQHERNVSRGHRLMGTEVVFLRDITEPMLAVELKLQSIPEGWL